MCSILGKMMIYSRVVRCLESVDQVGALGAPWNFGLATGLPWTMVASRC